jgi:holin-like protein
MRYLRGITVIFGITMLGECLNKILPFPVPAGVYGLFLMLMALCAGWVRLEDVSETGDFLLEIMPLMFIPAGVGLMTSVDEARNLLVPLIVITVISTLFVMAVTGWVAQGIIRRKKGEENGQ